MAVANLFQNGVTHVATVLGAMKNMTFKPFYGSQLETVVPKSTTKGEKFGLLNAGIGDRTGDAFTSRL